MIVRSIAARHGRRALAPVVRSCHRTIRTESLTGELTKETIEAFTARAAHKVGYEYNEMAKAHPGQLLTLKHLPQTHRQFKKVQKQTHHLGSVVHNSYVPSQLVNDPPRPKDITLELLMASQTHMGHHTSLWNPANARYIYGARQGIHLISLEVTAAHLRRAARVVEEVAYRGGLVLFVGTRRGQMDVVTKAARVAGGCHLFSKWTPGNITNRDIINRGKEIKVVDEADKALRGFELYQRTARPLLPDLVVCLNPLENYTMLYECGLANIPTIGVIDTNANPDWVTYTIPANDDSYRSIAVIGGVLGRAGEQGQKRRLADAGNGVVVWNNPVDTEKFMKQARDRWAKERRRWREDNADAPEKGLGRGGGGGDGGGEAQLLEMVQAQRQMAMFGEEALQEEVDQEIDELTMAEGALNAEMRNQLLAED